MDWDYLPQVWYFFDAIPIPEFSAQPWYLSSPPPPLPDALKLRSVFEGKIFGLIFRRRRKENGEQEEGGENVRTIEGAEGREGGKALWVGWLYGCWLRRGRARVGTYKGPIDPSIERLSGTGDGGSIEGVDEADGSLSGEGSGVADKEIFCFADANLGEVLKMGKGGGLRTMMVL